MILTVTADQVPCPDNTSDMTTQLTYSHSWQEVKDAFDAGKYVAADVPKMSSPNQLQRCPITEVIIAPTRPYIRYFDADDWSIGSLMFENTTSKVYTYECQL